jgi:CRP-like cAMP-binding protein
MFELFFKSVKEKVEISDDELEVCKSFFTPKRLRKRQYLVQEEGVCKYTAFVEKGILRSYTTDDKDNEHNMQFALEGWWIADQYSFYTGAPATYNIDALEDSDLLLITLEAHDAMLEKVPKIERYFRVLLQNSLIATQRRLIGSLSESAEEKYVKLVNRYPNIVQRVPQHMIASYLGITPETLSRIRKQIATKK